MSSELDQFNPPVGACIELAPNVRRIIAPNPSPMTYRGTNTYLIGTLDIAVIDPGPEDNAHLTAILDAVPEGGTLTHIIVTHSHIDHSPLAKRLSQATGAPIYAFGPSDAGRSAAMTDLIAQGYAGGGEGIDTSFVPDISVTDGDRITIDGLELEVLHTPGHMGNHICLAMGTALFSGDHVMGWASSMVSPPDGDLTDFMTSCQKLSRRQWSVFYPGHGDIIQTPNDRLDWLVSHRKSRETDILTCLQQGAKTPRGLAEAIYTETPPALLGAATRNVFAHLVDLSQRGLVQTLGTLSAEAKFTLKIKE